jgi:4-hydroxybenzoate polyprenyltransferase
LRAAGPALRRDVAWPVRRVCGNWGTVAERLLDACVFSSIWLALVAAALTAASSRALGAKPSLHAVALAAFGTLVVYNVDRLRDVERDRTTAPRRTAFVERHRDGLLALTLVSGLAAAALGLAAGWCAVALLAPVLTAGLLHRRLKRLASLKPLYVVAAWLAVVVGLPWCFAAAPSHAGWVLAVLGGAMLANAIASNVRDREAGAARTGPVRALARARAAALVGLVLALAAPPAVRSLAAVPALTLAVLARFRPGEDYGLVWVDGALLAGALLALAL